MFQLFFNQAHPPARVGNKFEDEKRFRKKLSHEKIKCNFLYYF